MVYSIETWPCYNIINDLGMANLSQINCTGCNIRGIVARVILYGQPYNPSTVEVVQPDHRIPFDKVNYIFSCSCSNRCQIFNKLFRFRFQDLLLCRTCLVRCEFFHKISHQKYLMYIECAKKVAEKNSQDALKSTTVILNELLADDIWLSQVNIWSILNVN